MSASRDEAMRNEMARDRGMRALLSLPSEELFLAIDELDKLISERPDFDTLTKPDADQRTA